MVPFPSGRSHFAALLALAAALSPLPPSPGEEERKEAPDPTTQKEIAGRIHKLFAAEYASRDPSAQRSLAAKLFITAESTVDDAAHRFVLFDEARQVAVKAGDIRGAFQAIEAMGRGYRVNLVELKLKVLDSLGRTAVRVEDQRLLLRECAATLGETAIERGHKEASQLLSLADSIAGKLKSPWASSQLEPFRRLLKTQKKEVEDASRAFALLPSAPDDLDANRLVGRFQCFVLGAWDEGLPRLARGVHLKLTEIARKEIAGPKTAERMTVLGDAWREASVAEKGTVQEAFLMRAYHWHLQAYRLASGIEKVRLDTALDEAPWRCLSEMMEFDVKVGWGQFCKDGTAYTEGQAIVDGFKGKKALFLHPPTNGYSSVRYPLKKKYRTLETHVGLVDHVGDHFRSTLVFEVLGDGKSLWKSIPITRAGANQRCEVKLNGVEVLELQVHCKGHNGYAQGVWLDPRVIR